MLAVDIYVNETTRHADVILPAPEPLEKSHYDVALYQLAVRNVANYSPPVFERSVPPEWQTFLRLAGIVAGQGPDADVEALDDLVIATLVQREVATEGSRLAGRDPAELIEALEPRRGPERLLDFLLRAGPYGDGFGERSRRPHPRAPGGQPARDRPRPARAAPARAAAHAVGQGRAGPGADPGRPAAAARRAGPRAQRRHAAHRPPPAALEQLLDAQPARAGEGQGQLHAPGPPRRRRAARSRGRRPRAGQLRRRSRWRRRSR